MTWAVTLLAAAIYTFTAQKLYRPQASLEIRPETPIVSMNDPNDPFMMASRLNYENYYRTQEQILTSPTLLEATLKALPEAIRARYEAMPDPAKGFGDRFDIEKIRSSFIIKVGFVDESPDHATQVVNTLVSLYLEDANRRLRELKSGAVEALAKETLPSMRARVDEADRRLQEFQKAAGFMDFEEQYKILIEKYRKYDSNLTELGLRKRKLQAELQALAGYRGNGVTGLFNPAFHSTRTLEPLADHRSKVTADLAKAENILKEKHPLVLELRAELRIVDEKIREAIQGTLKALETDLTEVETEEIELREDKKTVEKAVEEVGAQKYRYRQLESELTGAKELYSSYLRKHGETTATSSTALGSVRVIDHATVPGVPFRPRIIVNLMLAAIVGTLVGLGAVFVTEQLDDRIQSLQEVEAFVGLGVLGVIPRLQGTGSKKSSPILLSENSALPDYEAFRGLRSELVTRMEGIQGSRVICIVSALQSEGKSTITANLGKVLAMEGRRVLIIDGDLRRPSQMALIGSGKGASLEDVLRGSVDVESAVRASSMPGVDLLGAIEGLSSAPELAGSSRLDEIFAWARSRYDYIVVDLAPVNQVSESAIIARKTQATVLVVREGQTGRGAALAAAKRLMGMGANVVGAVLNCARPQGASYGYYYGYGHYGYGKS